MKILYVVKDMSYIELHGIMQLSALSKQRGHKSCLGIINEHDILKVIEKENPDIVAFSMLTLDASSFENLARDIKNKHKNLTIIAGGPHATFNPEIVDTWEVDAIICGEGDDAFVDFLNAAEGGHDYSDIKNLHTKAKKNPLRPLIDSLDKLPFPDRELVYFEGGHLLNLNVRTFMTSRGCAYRCTYCFNNKYNMLYRNKGKIFRKRSVDNVIEEILKVKEKYPFDFIRFGDDNFIYGVDKWMEEFSVKYKKMVNLPFYCLIRPNLINNEVVRLLRSTGCHSIGMSIEAGSESIREKILKRGMTDEELMKAFDIVQGSGIKVFANSIAGIPFATIKDEMKSIELAIKCKPAYPNFTIFTPFPGVELSDVAYKNNLVNGDLPQRTTDRSVLNCFTKKEKDIQENIVTLGPLIVRFPFLKLFILNLIMHLPPNRLFRYIWVVNKGYLGSKYIWPIKMAFLLKIKLFLKSFLFEIPEKRITETRR
ncbi:MAG: radical SAM protein [Candidatus Omnitrophota bacterium]